MLVNHVSFSSHRQRSEKNKTTLVKVILWKKLPALFPLDKKYFSKYAHPPLKAVTEDIGERKLVLFDEIHWA